jgi:hypothetical protein
MVADVTPQAAPFEAANTYRGWLPTERRIIAPLLQSKHEIDAIVDGSLDDLRAHIRRRVAELRIDATALPFDDLVFEECSDGVAISARMLVPDRDVLDHLEWSQIWRTVVIVWPALKMNGPDYLIRAMRELMASILAHEVDESIADGGERVFDPHRPLRSSP